VHAEPGPAEPRTLADGDEEQDDRAVAQAVAESIQEGGPGGLLMAKASRRPITMQLVMIRPTNTLSWRLMSNMYACRNWSATITRVETTAISTIMRILPGMMLRIREMTKDSRA
jgi:hypothetical protein